MLRAYVNQSDWEQYLPFVLHAYCTAVHASTGVSPFELMFGRSIHKPLISSNMAYDVASYQHQLQAKLYKLRDFVETYNSQASMQQKHHYDGHSSSRTFVVNDHVWLSVPTVGKLDPRWEGGWIIQAVKSSIT